MQKIYTIIQPEYVSKFQCDGNICDAMCCQKWRISIDTNILKKYKKIPDKHLRAKILSAIKLDRKTNLHEIKLNNHGKCPLVCDDSLCFIHRNLGEAYLSNTCATYPRHIEKINGYIEQSLAMTCPLATELALLNEIPMGFEQITLPSSSSLSFIETEINTQQLAKENPLMSYFAELQMFIISLLQNRNYTINQRLIILGLFLDKADELRLKNESDQLPALIELYGNYIASNEISQFITCIEPTLPEKLKLNLHLIDHLCNSALTEEIAPYIDMITQGLNLNTENNLHTLNQKYQENDLLYYQPFLKQYSYVFENFLVNDVFQSLFPFTLGKNLTKNYTVLISLYAIINFFCLNIATHYKENLSSEHILKFIQLFSRTKSSNHYITSLEKELDDKSDDILYFISACLK